jgi:hypothetical protein
MNESRTRLLKVLRTTCQGMVALQFKPGF